MADKSNIEWTDSTFNPWEGCTKVGPGCDHCYAENRNARFAGGTAINWGPGAPRRRTSAGNWQKPITWNAHAGDFFRDHGRKRRVFCASLADVFDNAVDPEWRHDLANIILQTPNLEWLVLTKRIGNAASMLGEMFLDGPPLNLRIGASIVNQEEAERDIAKLLRLGLPNFLSMEPLLACVDLTKVWVPNGILRNMVPALSKIDWVIVGGESGPGARPMNPVWARTLRDQCEAAGVPFLFKQWGEWMPTIRDGDTVKLVFEKGAPHGPDQPAFHDWPDGQGAARVGKKAAGRLLDGRTWDGFPS